MHKSEIIEEKTALVTHGKSTLGGFGGKAKNNSVLFSLFFFQRCTPLKSLSGPEKQITHKLNRLRNNIPSGRRQTSWLCTNATKDLNQVQLGNNPAASHSVSSFHVNTKYAAVKFFAEAMTVL